MIIKKRNEKKRSEKVKNDYEGKIMQSIRITSRPPSRIRKADLLPK